MRLPGYVSMTTEWHGRSPLTLLTIGDQVMLSFLDHCDVPQGLAEPQYGSTVALGVHGTIELQHKHRNKSWTHRVHRRQGDHSSSLSEVSDAHAHRNQGHWLRAQG